jgi:hypothetical protein
MTTPISDHQVNLPKDDLTTFFGRFRYFIKVTDPRTLIYSNAQVTEAKKIIDSCHKTG